MNESSQSANLTEDLTLRAWENDESVLGELVLSYAGKLERAIANEFRRFSPAEVEDVVAEAIKRFWEGRHDFDGQKNIGAYLYRIAQHVACELVSGRLNWQKSRNLERSIDLFLVESDGGVPVSDLEELESQNPKICDDLNEVVRQLSEIQQDVIWAYAFAGDFELDSAHLGRELGNKYKDGIPIPAGTIRQYKKRAKDKIFSEMNKRGYDLEKLGVGE
tara:strand:- start:1305 stop:1961 length:657 start_codon:yes stop_codon:yes gene_type:complete